MWKRIFITLIGLGIVFSSFCQADGVFWKISGKELKKPSYLFGTIHLICEGDFFISDQLIRKLQRADALVLEVDMDDPSLTLTMLSKMHNEDGEKITDFLTKEEYQSTRELLIERTGRDIETMKSMRPFILMSLIYPSLLECETKAVESELLVLAKTQNIEILGLESVDDQLSIFDQIPLEDQYRSFYEYVGDLERGRKEFRGLIEAYKKGEIELLVKMVSDSPEYKDYQDILLHDRNRNWIQPMEEFMRQGSIFFAVGAGHLGGEKGLVHLLRKKGYTVEKMEE
jgi:uncharacterized protein